jgi:integrase
MAQSSVNIHNNNDNLIDLEKRMELLTKGYSSYYNSLFKKLSMENRGNAKILYDFLETEYNIQNVKHSTIVTHVKAICLFNEYLNYKDFEKITKEDIIYYLSSLRKTESDDPTHKWIGTYNTRQMVLNKFFRWLYNHHQNNESDHEKWITSPYMQGIKQLSRKEKSPYKPSDIWTNKDHALFLKYCPEKRDKCYHAMANDTSCRPHELLSLKLKDIKFKVSSTRIQYAEVHIIESKTKPRTLPLIFSIPYIKGWIDSHPLTNNPDAFLFISLADSNFGQQLSENALYKQYTRSYKKRYFPKLLEDSSIPEADKSYIRNLLTKPWAPYIQRHSALTSKSLILKEHTLRDHAGWSMSSRMPQVYLHYFGNESSKSLLEAYGIENYKKEQIDILKSKTCPNCNEPNKPDGRFCMKCKMVLSYDSYTETLEKQKENDNNILEMKDQIQMIMTTLGQILGKQNDNDTKRSELAKDLIKKGMYVNISK